MQTVRPPPKSLMMLERLKPMPEFGYMQYAFVYLGLGDTKRALDALEHAMDERQPWAMFQPLRPSWLRGNGSLSMKEGPFC